MQNMQKPYPLVWAATSGKLLDDLKDERELDRPEPTCIRTVPAAFGDGDRRKTPGASFGDGRTPQRTKAVSFVTFLAAALITSTGTAQAQYLRDATQGFYGGMGAYGGGICCGPGGAVIGGAAGNSVGGWVYDTQRHFWMNPSPPRYAPVYPSRPRGYAGSTPMYLRPRW